jgi:hypothetical protein
MTAQEYRDHPGGLVDAGSPAALRRAFTHCR